MRLQQQLDQLASKISIFNAPKKATQDALNDFVSKTIVILMAGGESSRYSAVIGDKKINKNAHELPNGDTVIEMSIRMYRDIGVKKFIISVFHNAHSIEDRLGDGKDLGVELIYCRDPEKPVGRGGAILNILEQGLIPEDANLIVSNPDDVIMNYEGNFVEDIISDHLVGRQSGCLATAVMAPSSSYAYTGMMVVDNLVVDTEMYPMIPVPAHIGYTIFSPEVFPMFKKLFSLTEKTDFEKVLFPYLSNQKLLWATKLASGEWIALNDLKSYKHLVSIL